MIDFSKFNSLIDIVTYFNTPEKCKQTIVEARWSDGDIICPYCGQHHCRKRKDGRYYCRNCNHNFSEMVGTIFENTKVSLVKWFMAMYLISSHKKGISSHQLARDLGVTQKTAWYILHKIRSLYAQDDSVALEGEVEMDEMYFGGREKNKHKDKKIKNAQGKSLNCAVGVLEQEYDIWRLAAHIDFDPDNPIRYPRHHGDVIINEKGIAEKFDDIWDCESWTRDFEEFEEMFYNYVDNEI